MSAGPSSFFDSSISSRDLVNSDASTLFATATTPLGSGLYGGSVSGFNDGTANHGAIYDEVWGNSAASEYPATIDFYLDTSVNTLGYELTSITTVTGFQGLFAPTQDHMHQHSNQAYAVSYRLVGEVTFSLLATVSLMNDPDEFSAMVTMNGLESEIPGGVDAVRFTWFDPIPNTPLISESDESITMIREIDVFGSPITIPEPSSVALLSLATIGVFRRKRGVSH